MPGYFPFDVLVAVVEAEQYKPVMYNSFLLQALKELVVWLDCAEVGPGQWGVTRYKSGGAEVHAGVDGDLRWHSLRDAEDGKVELRWHAEGLPEDTSTYLRAEWSPEGGEDIAHKPADAAEVDERGWG